MSTWNAGEKAPNYSLDFYNGNTTVGSVPRTEIVNLELQRTVFSEHPTVGQAIAGELDAPFILPTFTIPRMVLSDFSCSELTSLITWSIGIR